MAASPDSFCRPDGCRAIAGVVYEFVADLSNMRLGVAIICI